MFGGLVVAAVLWPFSVAALAAWVVGGRRFNRWAASGAALALVSVQRLATGRWLAGESLGSWLVEVLAGLGSWALAAPVVSGFVWALGKVRAGWGRGVRKPGAGGFSAGG